ncbi:E3 ubiquitin-protein ligase TRIM21-like isoform X4 [Trichomycterus rosablanca]|uniref:E3 ubiquitin-protein ligase TRIM21-like isoform X4 n=1 Tax=Trichomycterus rosablanca TaxID=2290929 RepID=UPI002F3550E6
MASSSSVLSEDQLQCSICLDVFTDPVSTSCGHNFCMTCIKEFWDTSSHCQCPVCKMDFPRRPELHVNTFISGLAAQFRKPVQVKSSSIAGEMTKSLVFCEFCSEKKREALKSCLICMASYCKTHLEPHQRVSSFKSHKLIDPVENLEDYICQKHERPLKMFCRDDQMCVCQFCIETDHKNHNTVPIEEESAEKKTECKSKQAEIEQMIQVRLKKIEKIKHSVEVNKAEEFIKDLEQEITKLKRRNTELEQISNTEDHLHLLQIYPSLCRPPPTNNWTDVSIQPHLDVETLRRARSQLQECVDEEMKKVVSMELKRIQQYAVDVILDPDTANPELILSDDGKQVTDGDEWQDLPNNPERFYQCVFVMGKEGFSSGRFYYEVQVKGKTEWYLGVTRESSNRKGEITVSPEDGYWSVCLGNKTEYQALDSPHVLFSLKQAPQKVGVFVDYEEGLVSFYDVENESHIYSFTGQSFTEKLYPMFSPCLNDDGENSAPLIICPVSQVQS